MKNKHVHREPMVSDVIFKAVYGNTTQESKDALIAMLNLVLERTDDPIIDITHLNPFSIAEAKSEKVIIMDVKVETSKNELIDVEMQVGDMDVYINRTLYYGCKQTTKGLASGEDYDKMKKSIIVSFVKTKLFPQEVPLHSVYTMQERNTNAQLTDMLELHYIELGKINLSKYDLDNPEELDKLDPLERFAAYLKYAGDPDREELVEALVQKGEKVITMADTVLRKISEDERLQAIREDRETAEIFLRMEKAYARDKGLAEGHEIGLAEGLKQGQQQGHIESQREIATKLKAMGMTVNNISEATGLSEEEIRDL